MRTWLGDKTAAWVGNEKPPAEVREQWEVFLLEEERLLAEEEEILSGQRVLRSILKQEEDAETT